ncbi:MAG: hypothetical protein GF308_21315 [Candidatus Heimdallarchaeota archaeon]|nr:hypothetical protein [Candidatus Heimdallarchaeota archaeon]
MSDYLSPIIEDFKDIITLLRKKEKHLQSNEINKQGEYTLSLLSNLISDIDSLDMDNICQCLKFSINKETLVISLLASNAGGIIKQVVQVFPRSKENLLLEKKVILAEQLGLIGDAILQTAFHTYLSELPVEEIEFFSKSLLKRKISTIKGTYTELAKTLVSNENLEKLWKSWNIESLLGEYLKPSPVTHSRATIVEALVGMLFLQNRFRDIIAIIPNWINLVQI